MKAIVQRNFDGISGLEVTDVPYPSKNPMSALIKTTFTPVLPYDILMEKGQLRNMMRSKLPMIIGYGFGGVVEEVGILRNHHLVGQRVIGASLNGSNSEIINAMMPPMIFQVPDTVSLADATSIMGGADAALYATKQIRADKHDAVLISGAAGSVGTYLIQLLKNTGATVLATGHSSNHEFLSNVGADFVADYDQPLPPQLAQMPIVNKVIDTVGSKNLLTQISAYYDELIIFSLSMTEFRPLKKAQTFSFGNGSIGPSGYHELLAKLAAGTLTAYIQDEYHFTKVKEAQQVLQHNHSRGRLLLKYH